MKAVAQVATGRSNVETAAEEALSELAAKPTSGESPTELEVRNRPQAAVLAHRVRLVAPVRLGSGFDRHRDTVPAPRHPGARRRAPP